MTPECSTRLGFDFQPRIALDFDGGALSSDAGLVVLRELDARLGLTRSLGDLVEEARDERYVQHSAGALVRQRLYQIVAGYPDAVDANLLRHDPTFQVVVSEGRCNQTLASQPTLSRLENRVTWADIQRLKTLSLEWFLQHGAAERSRPDEEIVLDADPTKDPTYGGQQLALFHGKYRTYMYFPLLIFEGQTGHLLASRLRPGTVPDGEGILAELKRLVPRLRRAFPEAPLAFRADAGFTAPDLYDFLDDQKIHYLIGIPRYDAFKPWVEPVVQRARRRYERTGEPVRIFSSFFYRARRWPRQRRILIKVEVSAQGTNVRCVITNRQGRAGELFARYARRAQIENRIDELKNDLQADRLSCTRYRANAFRLQLHALAYNLVNVLRHHLKGTPLARAETSTLRLKLFRVAARVRHTSRRIWFHLSSGWPHRRLLLDALAAIRARAPAPA